MNINKMKEVNDDYYKHYPEDRNLKWLGCNYYINQGNNWHEPINTAQSMHDCMGCEDYNICMMKKDTPTWFYNKEIGEELDILYK